MATVYNAFPLLESHRRGSLPALADLCRMPCASGGLGASTTRAESYCRNETIWSVTLSMAKNKALTGHFTVSRLNGYPRGGAIPVPILRYLLGFIYSPFSRERRRTIHSWTPVSKDPSDTFPRTITSAQCLKCDVWSTAIAKVVMTTKLTLKNTGGHVGTQSDPPRCRHSSLSPLTRIPVVWSTRNEQARSW